MGKGGGGGGGDTTYIQAERDRLAANQANLQLQYDRQASLLNQQLELQKSGQAAQLELTRGQTRAQQDAARNQSVLNKATEQQDAYNRLVADRTTQANSRLQNRQQQAAEEDKRKAAGQSDASKLSVLTQLMKRKTAGYV